MATAAAAAAATEVATTVVAAAALARRLATPAVASDTCLVSTSPRAGLPASHVRSERLLSFEPKR